MSIPMSDVVREQKMRLALEGAMELILEMGTVIRSLDEENEHCDYWTNDGDPVEAKHAVKLGKGLYVPDDRFQAIEDALIRTGVA